MGAALKFRQTDVARQEGELARLKVVSGPDLGAVYVVTSARITIGRGDECDVVLTDLKTSRRHAELILNAGIGWSIQDLGSINGIAWNGKAVRSNPIKTRDTIGLGDTVLEFAGIEAGTMVLVAPPASPEQLDREQQGLAMQRARIAAMAQMGGLAKNIPRPEKFGSSPLQNAKPNSQLGLANAFNKPSGFEPKRLLIIGAVLAGGYLLMTEESPKKPTPRKEQEKDRDLANYLPTAESPALERTADMFYKTGFREYRQGNYIRARTQFETVLQMAPAHALAKLYLENCNQRIDEEVKFHLGSGRKSMEAGKLKEARGHFEAVQRLLHRDQSAPAFQEARDQLKKVIEDQNAGGVS